MDRSSPPFVVARASVVEHNLATVSEFCHTFLTIDPTDEIAGGDKIISGSVTHARLSTRGVMFPRLPTTARSSPFSPPTYGGLSPRRRSRGPERHNRILFRTQPALYQHLQLAEEAR